MNHIKRLTSNKIDLLVLSRIYQLEAGVKENFKKWYKQTLSSIIIVGAILLIGLFHYLFTTDNDILKLTVAVAYLISIAIFIKRRQQDIQTLIANRTAIKKYTTIVVNACNNNGRGEKMRAVAYTIYQEFYRAKTTKLVRSLHKITSFFQLMPTSDETFEIIYARMAEFIREVVVMQAVRYLVFIILFTSASIFIKNSVILEMRFDNIFETVLFPFKYFIELIVMLKIKAPH